MCPIPVPRFAALVLAGCVGLFAGQARSDTWSIRADYWCPYNCAPDDAHPGYMVEILQRTAARHGHVLDYRLMPWPRALQQARDGRITGVIGMVASNRDGLLMSQKTGVDTTCVFVLKGSTLVYRDSADLDHFGRIGVVEGYGYPDEFTRWSARNPQRVHAVAGDDPLKMQALKIGSGRIEAFVENINVVRYAESSIPELRWVGSVGCMREEALYFGYSKKNMRATEIQRLVDQELALMKKNGELRKLLDKYRVAPW